LEEIEKLHPRLYDIEEKLSFVEGGTPSQYIISFYSLGCLKGLSHQVESSEEWHG
jgi:hypothetical protein